MPDHMLLPSDTGYLQIIFRTDGKDEYPSLSDVGHFINDLNLLYEYFRITTDPAYADFRFDRFFVYRNHQRVDPQDRLYIRRITQKSPLEIAAVVVAIPVVLKALPPLAKMLENMITFPTRHRILKLKEQKLRKEIAQIPEATIPRRLPLVVEKQRAQYRMTVHREEHDPALILEAIMRHLKGNGIRIVSISVKYLRELPKKDDDKPNTDQI